MTDNSVGTVARLGGVGFDCAEVGEVADFYSAVLGLPVLMRTDDFALVGREGQPGLAFVRVADYRPPTWPDPAVPKQAHLDLGVDDLDAAQAWLIGLGAREPSLQPQPDRWRVLLDPAGHPFCVSTGCEGMGMGAGPKVGRWMTAKAIAGRGGELAAAMLEVAGSLRGFPGCEVYLISQDRADPDTVFVMEVWSDQAAVDAALEAARTAVSPAVSMSDVLALVAEPFQRVDLVPLGGVDAGTAG